MFTSNLPPNSRCCLYLRKSRQDVELDLASGGDTLARHRAALFDLARRYDLTVTNVYEEVVTGDTIDGRPQMLQLLMDVEDGKWDAVLCMDIDRLGRGGMRDQGRILDTFKWSNTSIITPDKIYRLGDDLDEEQIEFKAQMARFEYRQIKKRLARGRAASEAEGKFIGNVPPYGYSREKLTGQKGWKLTVEPAGASTVRQIFRWYTGEGCARLGVAQIVRRLNELHIQPPKGNDWTNWSVRSILSNEEYYGVIRSGNRPAKKVIENGTVRITRPRASRDEIRLYPGLHEPLITKEQFELAQSYLSSNKSRPGPKQVATKNPLHGLVICDRCGRSMVRRPYKDRRASLLCPYTSCSTVSTDLDVIESDILDGLRLWLAEFPLGEAPEPAADQLLPLQNAVKDAEAERAQLQKQKAKAYELIEQGVYTVEIFTQRMQELSDRISAADARLTSLQEELTQTQHAQLRKQQLLPAVAHVLAVYDKTEDPEEKNRLLRTCLSKVVYHKSTRDRSKQGSDLSLTLYPNF